MGIVEFQPSGFSKGSYLNVCAHLLWRPRPGGLTFDVYRRDREFISYLDDAQFAPLADAMAQRAATQLNALTATLKVPKDLLPLLAEEEHPSWQTFHSGTALALSGHAQEAIAQFARIVTAAPWTDWHRALQEDAGDCIAILQKGDGFRAHVLSCIISSRERHKLAAVPDLLRDAA